MPQVSSHPGIVVGVDGSPGSHVAVRWAARSAELRNVPLTLVHVLPGTPGGWLRSSAAPMRRRGERGRRALDEALGLAKESVQRNQPHIHCEMPSGLTVPALVKRSQNADMIAVGCLGTGTLRGRHLGSVSSGLVHHAMCPVAILHANVRLDAESERAPVLVGIDGSAHSDSAIAIAFDEASRRKVGLTALHAWSDVGAFDPVVSARGPGWRELRAIEDKLVGQCLAGWRERYPDVRVDEIVARDDPSHQLVETSAAAQLVVLGNHGYGGFVAMLLGSVSAAVMLLARVPVIVARQSR